MSERHRFHSICPYFAMFPETFVRRNVLDGRGATTSFWVRVRGEAQPYLRAF